ncbi:MAG: pyridoxal phosphate-dependent aminotransferase [Acidimicrobiia bacterium]
MDIARRMTEIPRIGLDIMGDQADALRGAPFRLENADSDIPPPAHVVAATREAVGLDEYNSWLPLTGLRELRAAVASMITRSHPLEYAPDTEVLITNGAQEGLASVLLALLDPGDEVITFEPAYSGIINRIRLTHGVPKFVALLESEGWRIDLDALESAVSDQTKAIVFNATNMPTGVVHTLEEVDAIAELARRHDLWVVYSAVSHRTVFDGGVVHNIATRPGMRDRTVIVDGVSKDFNLTAWRIGWVTGPASVVEYVARAHVYNGTLTGGYQQAGVVALLEDEEAMLTDLRARVEELQRRRDVVVDGIGRIEGLSCVAPNGGWWLLVDHREIEADDARLAQYLLAEANIAVTPMGTWGPSTAVGHFRVIFSNESTDRLSEAMTLVQNAVGRYKT